MNQTLPRLRGTTTGKLLFIGALTLLLLIPLGMIRNLVGEREQTREVVRAEIERAWGGRQVIGGPILVLPVAVPASAGASTPVLRDDEFYALPAALTVDGDADTQLLERGIFELPVFTASLSISGILRVPDLAADSGRMAEPVWREAVLALPISDPRSISAPVVVEVDGAAAEFEPGGIRVPGFGSQLVVPLSALGIDALAEDTAFTIRLQIGGVESLRFLPLGDSTTVTLRSDWPSPSFQGDYLPRERSVADDGFTAVWRVLSLGRGYPSAWRHSGRVAGTELPPSGDGPPVVMASFGVDLMPTLTLHAANLRTSKYGVLFIGLTFIAFFLFEVFKRLRLHPMQYLSVGMANVLFYLLLLAISEHFGFGPAYLFSASASTLLIAGYAGAILQSAGRALPIAAMLGGTYLQLYMILTAEDVAVLIGALTLFALLAAFMYLTRHVDWYALESRKADADRGGTPA